MANMIEMQEDGSFFLKARGSAMTLTRKKNGWEMHTINASSSAWRGGFGSVKFFDDLASVEKAYKSWQGISALVEMTDPAVE